MLQTHERDHAYARQLRAPGWTGPVSVLQDHRLFKRLPEFAHWTKGDHHGAAIASLHAAERMQEEYARAIDRALAVYGDGSGVLVSGVYRGHFPEVEKDRLRMLAREVTELRDRSLAHWRAAGRRVETWRGLREAFSHATV